jgi:hypothetical protein
MKIKKQYFAEGAITTVLIILFFVGFHTSLFLSSKLVQFAIWRLFDYSLSDKFWGVYVMWLLISFFTAKFRKQ